jgi:hypothetical protein
MVFAILNENQSELIAILNLSTDETITRTTQVTSAAVESGSDVSDHVRLDPEGGVFSGLLLDDPGESGEVRDRALSGATLEQIREASPVDRTRSVNTLARMKEALIAREPVTIVTTIEQLDNVILTRVVGRQRKPGVIEVNGAYRVIRRAQTRLVALPKPAVRSQSSSNKKLGDTKAKEASAEDKARAEDIFNKSGLSKAFKDTLKGAKDAVGGFLGGT